MVEPVSPLGAAWKPGAYPNTAGETGLVLSETRPGSIVQAAAWPGREKTLIDAIKSVTGLALADGAGAGQVDGAKAAFGFAPGKFLAIDQKEGLAAALGAVIDVDTGTVTDLSHGRTALRLAGPKADWVLAKFFALDFSQTTFPLGAGRATSHHDIFAQIQRSGAEQFDLYVFRSFARAFWTALCHASEETGYTVG
ncbi:sarcosine oxidase subunit gamma family protein [Nitratireductor sp. CAU 1489]|uniref:Sarcosine oxidase subunit gamma family protein n=1 Tax=Nitratireductor arenosus TaxID=2682096 RepID=A0A844QGX3_9HYPH|nr:sarcosine oxidase subunit gamma family protein [Nitratireductor arenosus]MVA97240.1 sarcosine oxidase subunit gamma family protein [Nitratireductor arenosus]